MAFPLRLLGILAPALAALAAPAAEVTWMLGQLPPMVMTQGPLAGQGAGQVLFADLLRRDFPAFEWRIEYASPQRVLHEMERRDGICSFAFARLPEREGKILFSRRAMTMPGFGVILREDRLGEFRRFLDRNGAVDLALLGQAGRLSGGYVVGRPHFGILQDFIDHHDPSLSLVADDSVRLFRQLEARRLDFLFGLRDETNYFAETLGQEGRFASLPIAGTEQYGEAALNCSIGPVGHKVMAAFDAFLADDRHWAEFVAPWRRWLSPADYAMALVPRQTSPVR